MATGGPQQYSGRSMLDAHLHLKMTNKEWNAFMHDLAQSLYKFKVPEREREEFVALVESVKAEMSLID
jgi:hemoglobin